MRPPQRPGAKLPPVKANAVLVLEEHPPEGGEPIKWLLLTSLPVTTFAEAQTVIGYYCCRWEIELLFKRWKSLNLVAELCGSTELRQMVRVRAIDYVARTTLADDCERVGRPFEEPEQGERSDPRLCGALGRQPEE